MMSGKLFAISLVCLAGACASPPHGFGTGSHQHGDCPHGRPAHGDTGVSNDAHHCPMHGEKHEPGGRHAAHD
jgi:hypothetical protein